MISTDFPAVSILGATSAKKGGTRGMSSVAGATVYLESQNKSEVTGMVGLLPVTKLVTCKIIRYEVNNSTSQRNIPSW